MGGVGWAGRTADLKQRRQKGVWGEFETIERGSCWRGRRKDRDYGGEAVDKSQNVAVGRQQIVIST